LSVETITENESTMVVKGKEHFKLFQEFLPSFFHIDSQVMVSFWLTTTFDVKLLSMLMLIAVQKDVELDPIPG